MRIAFYAPLNAPTASVPSGDRRVAGLLIDALRMAGHGVALAAEFRSYDGTGDAQRQRILCDQGLALAERLLDQWRTGPADARPELWFTYHLYHKAPDWLGPTVSRGLGIPYVVAEPSHAPKRAWGPWASGLAAAAEAIRQANLLLAPSREDLPALAALRDSHHGIVHLPPFLDASPYHAARQRRPALRAEHARRLGIDAAPAWISVVAMMRPGDKLASYRELSQALAHLLDLDWRLIVAGDGPARAEVEDLLEIALPGRVHLLGALDTSAVAALLAASDLFTWPAVNEAYGMALLEAQAAGVPVVAGKVRGVPEVVCDGETGLLTPAGDTAAFASAVRRLLTSTTLRAAFSAAAHRFVATRRGLPQAAASLDALLSPLTAVGSQR